MPIEIERKFLVESQEWKSNDSTFIRQGYLNQDKNRTVRVRTSSDRGYLTIKGRNIGARRKEFEYEIPLEEAIELLELAEGSIIEKNRFRFVHAGLVWEVDEFLGDNSGLVIAEIEVATENQSIAIPNWVGEEVTLDPRFFNSSLSKNPYKNWHAEKDQDLLPDG